MPPWKPVGGFGEFKNERRLSDEEIALIARWVEIGSPAGDLQKLPPPPTFASGWPLGEPDAILEMPETYEIGPEGEDEYRNFVIPTNFICLQHLDVRCIFRNRHPLLRRSTTLTTLRQFCGKIANPAIVRAR